MRGRAGRGGRVKVAGWSRKALKAAKACSGVRIAKARPGRAGRRTASIERAVRVYYLG